MGKRAKGRGGSSISSIFLEATDADTEIAIVQPAVAPLQVPQRSRLLRAEESAFRLVDKHHGGFQSERGAPGGD